MRRASTATRNGPVRAWDAETGTPGLELPGGTNEATKFAQGPGGLLAIGPEQDTDVGLFDVVFGGAAGAMQPFSKRLTQDEILKIMAYVRSAYIKK